LGGFLLVGAANVVNQIWECELDKKMKRTQGRPLPTGRLSNFESIVFASILAVIGTIILFMWVNPLAAGLTLLSGVLYGFVYTPLKQKSPIAVGVGAIPGAMPSLIGWAAATGSLDPMAWVLFGIQFSWQFPHFWAIAWVLDDDYKRAGFKLLPGKGERDFQTALQIVIYTVPLIPLGLMPAYFGVTGLTSAVVATVCGTLFLMQTFYLMRNCTNEAAKRIMFGSFFYLPIVQIAFLLDKVH
jgi:protoheme IX farnesyltransferase